MPRDEIYFGGFPALTASELRRLTPGLAMRLPAAKPGSRLQFAPDPD
jgi:hypothetical protein